jgi:hypothetical protein
VVELPQVHGVDAVEALHHESGGDVAVGHHDVTSLRSGWISVSTW